LNNWPRSFGQLLELKPEIVEIPGGQRVLL
jgi:hypothetical protein